MARRLQSGRSIAVSLILLIVVSLVPGLRASAASGTHAVISAVYADTALSYEPDEAVQIHNPTAAALDLSGWRLCNDNGSCATLPTGTALNAGASLWIAREADDFLTEWTFRPALEMIETDGTVPNTTGSAPVFSNAGVAIYLKNAAGAIIDMVVYGSGVPAAGEPWTGPTVPVVSQGQLLHRAFPPGPTPAA